MAVKIIAVWGHQGKTTFAVNLAYSIARYKPDKIITLLSSNLTYGDIQGYYGQHILQAHGLSKALEQGGEEHARKFLWKAGNEGVLSHIFLMSLPNMADALDLEPPSLDMAERLIEELSSSEQTDYLLVDCATSIHNPISSCAIAGADVVLCLHRPGGASFQWYTAMNSFIAQLYLEEKLVHLLYAHDNSCSAPQYFSELSLTITDEVPCVRNSRQYEANGIPMCAAEERETASFRQSLRRIAELL